MTMKLTKYVHSCVLVEDQGKVALFDPDNFTWGSKTFPIDSLKQLDYILITHTHGDHYSLDFVKALLAKFPKAAIFTTEQVAEDLKDNGVTNVSTSSQGEVEVTEAPHEDMTPLTGHPNDENVAITLHGKITHPGDSLQINETAAVLLLPVDGPWGSTVEATKLAKGVKPKYVLPIHDAMHTDDWRGMNYDWVENFCKQNNITFLRPEPGKPIEVAI